MNICNICGLYSRGLVFVRGVYITSPIAGLMLELWRLVAECLLVFGGVGLRMYRAGLDLEGWDGMGMGWGWRESMCWQARDITN